MTCSSGSMTPPLAGIAQLTTAYPPTPALRSSRHNQIASSTWIAGTPSTPTENSASRLLRLDTVSCRQLAEQERVHRAGVGDHQPPRREEVGVLRGPEPLTGDARTDPEPGGVNEVGVERPHRHAGFDHRDQQRVVDQVDRAKAAVQQAQDRRLLARDPVGVGIEADLTKERAVCVRDRLSPHRHDACAAVAVG